MRILHYFLGPHRKGGLNRYVRDLAQAQREAGHDVFLLYPAGGLWISAAPKLGRHGAYQGVPLYRLLGGKAVPLLEGVCHPDLILAPGRLLSQEQRERFWEEVSPEILHIHSWMGFPAELLETAKAHGGRCLFTTHDYYGLCPKVNFVTADGQYCTGGDDALCTRCNAGAPGERALSLRNCQGLLALKGLLRPFLPLLQRRRRSAAGPVPGASSPPLPYGALRQYYLSLLSRCDGIHCNSQVAWERYRHYLSEEKFHLLPITHGALEWAPCMREPEAGCLRLGFSGPEAPFKGLPMLLETLGALPRGNWRLEIWGTGKTRQEGPFLWRGNYRDYRKAFASLDLLIVPSLWDETFGFIVPEALSQGVPVLCSRHVGAQSLLPPELVFQDQEDLGRRLARLLSHPEELVALRRRLVADPPPFPSLSRHQEEMTALYRGLLS